MSWEQGPGVAWLRPRAGVSCPAAENTVPPAVSVRWTGGGTAAVQWPTEPSGCRAPAGAQGSGASRCRAPWQAAGSRTGCGLGREDLGVSRPGQHGRSRAGRSRGNPNPSDPLPRALGAAKLAPTPLWKGACCPVQAARAVRGPGSGSPGPAQTPRLTHCVTSGKFLTLSEPMHIHSKTCGW